MSMYQNPAAVIASRLKLDREIPSNVLQQTQGALRLFKVKNPTGTFGKQDNDLKRACALLEYVYREMEGVKIPINRLAKAACMKEKDFINFHQTIGNFRNNTASRNSTCSSSSSSSLVPGNRKRSSIPSLAIKLGSFVNDSNGVASRAIKLFDKILNHSKNMPASERAYQLRDMKEHQTAYEAACFYVIATSEKILTSSRSTSISTRIKQDDDDDDNKQLAISSVLDVSNDFTLAEFKNILMHIQNLCQEMETGSSTVVNHQKDSLSARQYQASKKRPNISTAAAAAATTALQQRMPVTTTKRLKSKGSLSQDLASNATMELLLKTGKNRDADFGGNDPMILGQYEDPFQKLQGQKFLDWKKQVIAMTIERTQKDVTSSETDNEKGSEIDFLALDQAAREIIEKYTSTPTN